MPKIAQFAAFMALLSAPAHADRTVCQKWVTVGMSEDQTEYLVDVWSIVDHGTIKTFHYDEDRSKSAKSSLDGFKVIGMSSYHAVDCEKMVYADINVPDADLSKVEWMEISDDVIASREAEVVCTADLSDRPQGIASE